MSTRKKRVRKPKYKKLTRRRQKLAGKYIAEEMETGKYHRKQSIAIGLSRARKAKKKTRRVKS